MGFGKVFQGEIEETMSRQEHSRRMLIDYSNFAFNPFQECRVRPDRPPKSPSAPRLPPRPKAKRDSVSHFCAYCGRRIADDAFECPGCGAPQ